MAASASASTSYPAPSAPPSTAAPAKPILAEASPSCPAAEAPRQPSATTTAPAAAVTAAGDASATSTPPTEGSARAAGPSQLWDAFVACEEPLEVRRLWTVRAPARTEIILRLCESAPTIIDGDGGGDEKHRS